MLRRGRIVTVVRNGFSSRMLVLMCIVRGAPRHRQGRDVMVKCERETLRCPYCVSAHATSSDASRIRGLRRKAGQADHRVRFLV